MAGVLRTSHGDLALPAFLPDATRGVIRAAGAGDVAGAGIGGLVVNALHLSREPGTSVVEAAGGIHRFMGWEGPILSDSGGFQVYSLISRSKSAGRVSPDGFTFRLGAGEKKTLLTPEGCVDIQLRIGADIAICLDYCTHPRASKEVQRESVDLTIAWAARCKAAFRKAASPGKLLFAVVQGGDDPELRRRCAGELTRIGFDGYGFGGWPADSSGRLAEVVRRTAGLLPADAPKMGLGIGKPANIVEAFEAGYRIFDCTIPTRDARHGSLYVFDGAGDGSVATVRIEQERYTRDRSPVEAECDCACCRRYSRAYLHHLFAIGDALGHRLATIHNLRLYARLMDRLRRRGGP